MRLLIDRVELSRRGGTELVDVVVHWRGGAQGRHVVRQRLRSYDDLGQYDELRARVSDLRGRGMTGEEIATVLNREGFVMPRGAAFNGRTVRHMSTRFGSTGRPAGLAPGEGLGRSEWWLPELAYELGVRPIVVHRWRWSGCVTARQLAGDQSRWIVWANTAEVRRLRRLRAYEESYRGQTAPSELTTPLRAETDKGPKPSAKTRAKRGGK